MARTQRKPKEEEVAFKPDIPDVVEEDEDELDLDNMSVEELTAKKMNLGERIKKLQLMKRQVEDEERANRPPPRRGRGVMSTAKRILWFEPNIDIAELHKRVVAECGPCSLTVIQTVRSDFRNTIEVLRELGKLKEEPGMSDPPMKEEEEDEEEEGFLEPEDNEAEEAKEEVKVEEPKATDEAKQE